MQKAEVAQSPLCPYSVTGKGVNRTCLSRQPPEEQCKATSMPFPYLGSQLKATQGQWKARGAGFELAHPKSILLICDFNYCFCGWALIRTSCEYFPLVAPSCKGKIDICPPLCRQSFYFFTSGNSSLFQSIYGAISILGILFHHKWDLPQVNF